MMNGYIVSMGLFTIFGAVTIYAYSRVESPRDKLQRAYVEEELARKKESLRK